MTAPAIRPKAICIIRRGDEILVAGAYDAATREPFVVPLGGGIEFGERAADAVRRELREELGVELEDLAPLGVLENVFTYEGRPGHEIVFVLEARLADPTLYGREEIEGVESDRAPFVARWLPLSNVDDGGPPLYPSGLLALLRADAAR